MTQYVQFNKRIQQIWSFRVGSNMKWYGVDCLLQLAFILLNSLQTEEKSEIVNLFYISLYALPKFSSWPNSISETIFPVWLDRDCFSVILSSPLSMQLDCIEILPLLFLWICLFHNFSRISHLSFCCTMCCSSVLATWSLQVLERYVLSLKNGC